MEETRLGPLAGPATDWKKARVAEAFSDVYQELGWEVTEKQLLLLQQFWQVYHVLELAYTSKQLIIQTIMLFDMFFNTKRG